MPEDPASKIQRHRRTGVVVDSGLLVIYFAGLNQDQTGIPLWQTLKETNNKFEKGDYEFLTGFLKEFRKQVVTPHILAEVNSMLGQLYAPADKTCRSLMRGVIPRLEECSVDAAQIISDEAFLDLGITDVGIRHAASAPYLVLTIDRPLEGHLNNIGVDALLFQNIRYAL